MYAIRSYYVLVALVSAGNLSSQSVEIIQEQLPVLTQKEGNQVGLAQRAAGQIGMRQRRAFQVCAV